MSGRRRSSGTAWRWSRPESTRRHRRARYARARRCSRGLLRTATAEHTPSAMSPRRRPWRGLRANPNGCCPQSRAGRRYGRCRPRGPRSGPCMSVVCQRTCPAVSPLVGSPRSQRLVVSDEQEVAARHRQAATAQRGGPKLVESSVEFMRRGPPGHCHHGRWLVVHRVRRDKPVRYSMSRRSANNASLRGRGRPFSVLPALNSARGGCRGVLEEDARLSQPIAG